MSQREVSRAEVLARVKAKTLKLVSAAEILEISYRQAKRLWKRYKKQGAEGLIHGNAGRRSNQAKPKEFRRRALQLVRDHYSGGVGQRLGPQLAAEHLEEEHGVSVNPETLRLWMLEAGLWSRQRKHKPYRRRRERKAHFGELVQMDGSFHQWLEDRGPQLCLMNMVDDATGTTLARFHEQETIWGAVDVLRAWIEKYGVPRALYTDWKNVYVRQPNHQERESGQTPLTQFGRMCAALGTRIIAASSPQAKGRVERNHGTHQDRLVKKLRLKQVSTMEGANTFLKRHYIASHNRRFTRAAADADDFHRAAPAPGKLGRIFCLEHERVIANDWVIQYGTRLLQLEKPSRYAPAGQRVTVCESASGELRLYLRDQPLAWKNTVRPPKPAPEANVRAENRGRSRRQPDNHPWRRLRLPGTPPALQPAPGSPKPGLPSAGHSAT